jgi:hypothetical protein
MADRPKLEIVRTEDGVDVWLGGKIVSQHVGHLAKLEAVEETARAIAAALGADIDETDDPAPQPYTYFVVYQSEKGHVGNAWLTNPGPIETADAMRNITDQITARKPELGGVVITNFIYIDGPY